MRKTFTHLTITIFLSVLTVSMSAQDINWSTAAPKGIVFRISNREAKKLLTKDSGDSLFKKLLHTPVDTFDVAKGWTDRPEKGHFILATVIKDKLHCEYTSVFPYQVFLLKEYDALSLQVLDLEGNVREDAKVKYGWSRINIDKESKTYRIQNVTSGDENRVATVELDGFRSVFRIQKHGVPNWYGGSYSDDGPSFYSYMITDKNRYKPGEKVRYKSFALSHAKTLLRRDLEVVLIDQYKRIKLGAISPHRPGSYAGEFHLHDSLKLTLDRKYTIQLQAKSGRTVATSSFRYEDYELHRNNLEVKLATDKHFYPSPNRLTIEATDVNGLTLKDARASVFVRTHTIRETFQPLVSLPDTLLYKQIALDGSGPTEFEIPTDMFQKTNTSYEVVVSVRNSQNNLMEKVVGSTYYFSQYEISTRFSNDSIIYELLKNAGPLQNVHAQLKYNDETESRQISLPYAEKLNPAIKTVSISTDLASRQISMSQLVPRLEIRGGIEKDSFNIQLFNPQQLEVSWYIYQGDILLQKGFGKALNHRSLITNRDETFYVELLYSFGGEEQHRRREFRFMEDRLNIALNLPERVYPGQQVDALIEVTDQRGNPVNNVDLTALATTAKLDHELPDLPYYGDMSLPRSVASHYSKEDVNKPSANLELNYKYWNKRLALDTMKYYQFTYPRQGIFRYTASAEETQFAPFVMHEGRAKEIIVVEVDRTPVYYSWTNHPAAYSFKIAPAVMHQVTLRLHDRVLILDSLVFEAGKKTILSIDLDHLPKKVKTLMLFTKPKKRHWWKYPTFSPMEISRYTNYIASFSRGTGNSYLEWQTEFTPLFSESDLRQGTRVIAGPILSGTQTYRDKHTNVTYQHDGGFNYSFKGNVVYKQDAKDLLPTRLFDEEFDPTVRINDKVITKKFFLEYKDPVPKWHARFIDLVDYSSRVNIMLPSEKAESGIAGVFFENCTTKELVSPCRNYSKSSSYYTIPRGCFNTIVLYNNGTYLRMNKVSFQSYRSIVIDLRQSPLNARDSLSENWLSSSSGNCYNGFDQPKTRTMAFYRSHRVTGNVRGRVYSAEDNTPLPGVNVVEKGTANGTVADIDGEFSLDISERNATLVFSFIGLQSQEVEVQVGSDIMVSLAADVTQLQEVVVTGYGASTERRNLTYALQGKVRGLQTDIDIEIEREALPDEEFDEETGDDPEQQLYAELMLLNRMRSNFSDVGFWEPRLFTDRKGHSRFSITFPDDITRWDATVYAMNRRLQTGTFRKSIRSYKPIMAELHMPQFLTEADSSFLLGKVLNYTQDKNLSGKISWKNSQNSFDQNIDFSEYYTNHYPVYASLADSITTSFQFTRDDGYMDGEERSIPVVEQGVIRANGTLGVLKNNETAQVKAHGNSTVNVEIFDNPLDVYAGDVRYLLDYQYACNEQLASKLLGLIAYRMLMQYEQKPFRYDKDVNKMIERLLKNQNDQFLWSWWNVSSSTSYWMSAHILRALKAARDAGYKVNLDVDNLAMKASYRFDYLKAYYITDIDLLNALASWGAKLEYKRHLQVLDSILVKTEKSESYNNRYHPFSLLAEKLHLLETRQILGLDYDRNVLLKHKRDEITGGTYFSEKKPALYWYYDDLTANSIAYRIVKRDSVLRHLRTPMQLYFLTSRQRGEWNTYYAANVLMSILPDIIADGATKKHPATVQLSGKVNETVRKFPFSAELNPGEELSIRKDSGIPLYWMQYTTERVKEAKTGVEGFSIKTYFTNGNNLKAGEPVTLTVEITAKKEIKAEYVMIEVPVLGACSYADKRQPTNRTETHREYFKERTVIFCENMSPGKYAFAIQLLPRFTGKYFVNPAQVSLMYIPVVNANTDMKRVEVK